MKSIHFALLLGCVVALTTTNLVAQDYTTQTLSFDNITSSNLNSDGYSGQNEKEIEFADYDLDGDLDVVVAAARGDFTQRTNKLYRNDNGVLNEVTSTVIPGFLATDTSRSAYMRDFTGDGFPDIIIINDSNSGTANNNSPGRTKFYRNVGGTSFVNESQRLDGQTGAACNGAVADFDGNGLLDLMMVNYPNTTQDSIGLNGINGNTPGNFDDVTSTNMPPDTNFYGVHGEAADMNGDGLVDILVANRTNQPSFIYYNNLNGAGSGDGDFRYGAGNTAGRQTVADTSGGVLENAMVPADFNNDGMMDMYYANSGIPGGSSSGDSIYVNTGNNAQGFAQFDVVPLIPELNGETFKVTIADLDNDGRQDAVVMSEDRRPYILRNTSENGEVSFIDWTPSIFNSTHEGWQANMGDVTGNGRDDVMVGSITSDFLFENVNSQLTDASTLNAGILPSFNNTAPIAVTGQIDAGETLTFLATTLPPTARVSMLARSVDADLSINVLVSGISVASSDRPGEDVDEAVSFTQNSTGAVVIELTNNSEADVLLGDINGDGTVNLLDVSPFIDELSNSTGNEAADLNQDGVVNLLDVAPFIDALNNGGGGTGGGSADFVLEGISRTN